MKKIISVLLATFLIVTMVSCRANPTNEDIEGVWKATYTDENGDEISCVLMFASTSGDDRGVYSYGRDVNGRDDYTTSGTYYILRDEIYCQGRSSLSYKFNKKIEDYSGSKRIYYTRVED